ITAAHVAYQHHERLDGGGYPRQLAGKQILEYGQIAAVADTFDAVVADRPYRKGYSTPEGALILKKLSNTFFHPDIVDAFTANIAIFPVGSLLHLNTGHIAVVTSVTKLNSSRPVVNVICDTGGNLLQPPFEIDLAKTDDVKIAGRLNHEETNSLRVRVGLSNDPQLKSSSK
ncbi:MAG: HD-GYP domain-containing protein, partial [Ignavibacteriales bacterium]